MKIAIGSDRKTFLTDFVIKDLKKRKYKIGLFGALKTGKKVLWPKVGEEVAKRVAQKEYNQGILFCLTGTGASIVANKIPGIRAALCNDAKTAQRAREWNDANILVISLRQTSEILAKEILDSWFSASFDQNKKNRLDLLEEIEKRYLKK